MISRIDKSLLRRAAWLVFLVGHAPALWRHAMGLVLEADLSAHLGAALGLALTSAFFLLKVLDVSWLRFRSDWRSCCALLMVVGFIHADVIAHSTDSELQPAILLTGATCLLIAASDLRATMQRPVGRRLDLMRLAPLVCRLSSAIEVVAPPPQERLHSPHHLRAPPQPDHLLLRPGVRRPQ